MIRRRPIETVSPNGRTGCKGSRQRGGLLFEVLVSLAIFVMVASFTLAATRNVFDGLSRSHREQQAIDLARSKLAELEAGIIGIADLRGETIRRVGSIEDYGVDADGRADRWLIELRSERTAHRDLTLIELTVREELPGGAVGASFTLRQLVRLREVDAETYEEDELLEGLTDARGGAR